MERYEFGVAYTGMKVRLECIKIRPSIFMLNHVDAGTDMVIPRCIIFWHMFMKLAGLKPTN
jgi:hypothetical protein